MSVTCSPSSITPLYGTWHALDNLGEESATLKLGSAQSAGSIILSGFDTTGIPSSAVFANLRVVVYGYASAEDAVRVTNVILMRKEEEGDGIVVVADARDFVSNATSWLTGSSHTVYYPPYADDPWFIYPETMHPGTQAIPVDMALMRDPTLQIQVVITALTGPSTGYLDDAYVSLGTAEGISNIGWQDIGLGGGDAIANGSLRLSRMMKTQMYENVPGVSCEIHTKGDLGNTR